MSAQDKFRYYISQIDKEVRPLLWPRPRTGAPAEAEVFPSLSLSAPSSTHPHCARHRLSTAAQLSKYPTLNNIEARTNVPKAYGVLGFTTVFASLVFFNVAAGFLSTLLGWALPAYFSLKALETPSHGDDTQWLTYWVVFGAFQIVEYFAGAILYWSVEGEGEARRGQPELREQDRQDPKLELERSRWASTQESPGADSHAVNALPAGSPSTTRSSAHSPSGSCSLRPG